MYARLKSKSHMKINSEIIMFAGLIQYKILRTMRIINIAFIIHISKDLATFFATVIDIEFIKVIK